MRKISQALRSSTRYDHNRKTSAAAKRPVGEEIRISSIRSIDLRLVDDLVDFVRGRGFVLDFSDSSFSEFFTSELQVNIDDPQYAEHGGSKGKRLRAFFAKVR